jgi:hypothetical protein
MQKLALVFLFYHQLFVCLLPVGEGAGSGDGFLYFDGPDDLFTNYDSVITEQEWMGDLLANFQRVPDKRERDRPKTLLCHDFKGGYQPYERYCALF